MTTGFKPPRADVLTDLNADLVIQTLGVPRLQVPRDWGADDSASVEDFASVGDRVAKVHVLMDGRGSAHPDAGASLGTGITNSHHAGLTAAGGDTT